jgi:hypothetical protein
MSDYALDYAMLKGEDKAIGAARADERAVTIEAAAMLLDKIAAGLSPKFGTEIAAAKEHAKVIRVLSTSLIDAASPSTFDAGVRAMREAAMAMYPCMGRACKNGPKPNFFTEFCGNCGIRNTLAALVPPSPSCEDK